MVPPIVMLLEDRLLIEPDKPADRTASGLYLPETRTIKSCFGRIRAVGPGRDHPTTGKFMPQALKVGQHVVYGTYGGITFEPVEGGTVYKILRPEDVFGVLPD